MKNVIISMLLMLLVACEKGDETTPDNYNNQNGTNNNNGSAISDTVVKYELKGTGHFLIEIKDSKKSVGFYSSYAQIPFTYTMTYASGDTYDFHCERYSPDTSEVHAYMYLNGSLKDDVIIHSGGANFTGTIK